MELFLLVIPFLALQSVSAFDWPLPDNPRYQTVMPHNEHRYWPPEVISEHRYWPPPQPNPPPPPDPLPPHRVMNVQRPPVTNNRNHRPSTRDSIDAVGGSSNDRFRSSQTSDYRFRSQEPSSPVRHVPYDEPYHHPMDHYQPSERSTESSFHATEVPMSSVYNEPKESPSYSQANERVKPQQNFRQSANHVRVKERIPVTNFQFDHPPPQETPPKELHHYGHDVFNDPRDLPEDQHSPRGDEVPNVREHSSPKNKLPLQVDKESEEELRREEEAARRREEDRLKEEKRIKEEADRIREETRRRDENRRRDEDRRRREEERRKIEELRRREEARMREEARIREEEERRKEEDEKYRDEERRKDEEEDKLREEEKKEKERLSSREQPNDEGSDYDRAHEDSKHDGEGGQSWPLPKPPVTEAPKVEAVTKSYRPRPVSRPRNARFGRRRTGRTTTTTTTTPAPLQPAESDQPEYYDEDDDYYDYQPTTTTQRPRRRRPKGRRRMRPEATSSTTPSTTTKRTTLSPNYRQRPDGRIIDFRADPNYPHELKGFDLTEYPFYIQVPDGIKFKCDGRHDGYYANIEHFCQIYHHCAIGNRYDFLCPNYTLFDQTTFTCRFVNMVDCKGSAKSYDRNFELYAESTTASPSTVRLQTSPLPPAPSITTPSSSSNNDQLASFSNTNARFKRKENISNNKNKEKNSSSNAGSTNIEKDRENNSSNKNKNDRNINSKSEKQEQERKEEGNNSNKDERTTSKVDEEKKKTSSAPSSSQEDKNNNNHNNDEDDYVDIVNEE